MNPRRSDIVVASEPVQPLDVAVGPVTSEQQGGSLFAALRARWGTALVCFLLFASASVGVILHFVKPAYLVAAQIEVKPVTPPILQSDVNVDITRNYDMYLATQRGIMMSPDLIAEALDSSDVRSAPRLDLPGDPIASVLSGLAVDRVGRSELVRVSMTGQQPETLAAIVNGIVATYLRRFDDDRRRTDEQVLSSLREEQALLEAKLKALGETLRGLVQDGGPVLDANGVLTDESVAIFRQMLTSARTQRTVARAQLDALQRARESGNFNAVDLGQFETYAARDPQLLTLKDELRRLQTEAFMDQALGRGANHPEVMTRPARIAALQEGMKLRRQELRDEFLGDEERRLLSEIRSAEIQEETVETALSKAGSERVLAARQQFAIEDVRHERDQVEAMLTQVKNKIYTVGVEQKRIPRVTLKSPARAPEEPNIDKRPKLGAVALGVSFCMACGIALLRHQMDRRLRTPQQISHQLGVRVLGSVQHVRHANGTPTTLDQEVREPVRGISTALLAARPEDSRCHTRLITSPTPGSGKSSIAVNLARSVAATGRRVLLIDADNYRRGLSRRLGLQEVPGMTEYLRGELEVKAALQATDLKLLSVVSAGVLADDYGALLAHRASQERLARLCKDFDEVIFDSPPVLASSHALVLATLVDEVVLVLRAGRTCRDEAEAAREQLASVGARVVGAILNGVDPRRMRYGYGYGYSYEAPVAS